MLFIHNARLFPMDGQDDFIGSLLVRGGKIAAVGKDVTPPRSVRILDGDGLVVTPGLIDAHSHIGLSEEKKGADGNDCNEATNPITPQMRAVDAINPMDAAFHNAVAAGVTSVLAGPGSSNVVGGQFAFLKTYGRCVDEQVVRAPAAMKIALGENPKNCYGANGNMPSTRMGVAALLRKALQEAADYCHKRAQNDADFVPDAEMEAWVPVFSREIPLKAHVHRADDILTALRIAREFSLDLTLDHCTEGHLIADQIRQSGFPAIVGPSLASRSKIEVARLDFKTAGVLQKAGVPVAITMDHPVTLIQYLSVAAAIAAREGLGEQAALAAITSEAARICRVSDRVGSLRVGLDADIAVFDRFPLDVRAQCLYTLIDGRIVFDRAKEGETPR